MSTTNDNYDASRTNAATNTARERGAGPGGLGPLLKFVIALVIVFAVLLAIGLAPRLAQNRSLQTDSRDAAAPPTVIAVPVQSPPRFDTLTLPGNVDAAQQTAVVARASGYVKQYFVDIGDHVRAGQVLAMIESPDVDQQVEQAKAQYSQAQAAFYQAQAALANQDANFAQAQAAVSRSNATLEQARTQREQARAAVAQALQESAQESAQVISAQANLDLAKVTATRYQNLLRDGAIDRQTTDQAVAAYKTSQANVQALQSAVAAGKANVQAYRAALASSGSNVRAYEADVTSSKAAAQAAEANIRSAQASVLAAEANVQSNQANVAREAVLQGFENVTAPFAGTITARNIDNGALISAAGTPVGGASDAAGSGSAQPSSLFDIADLDKVRVYLSVPQSYAGAVRVGQRAAVTVDELPGKVFTGAITRTAGAYDPTSRTLVAEATLPNPGHLLRPGMFASVRLRLPHIGNSVTIPDSSLVTGENGNQAVLIEPDDRIHFQPITVGRDLGKVIEVLSGLHMGQKVAASPSDALVEGEKVTVRQAQTRRGGG